MDILKLKSFCKVYEFRNFSKAASALYLSQPTISSHILSLEKELGVRLFDRMSKFVIPTSAGDRLYSYAKDIVLLVEKAEKEMKFFQGRVTGRLIIGGSTIPGHYILPRILKTFKEKYKEVDLILEVGDSYKILKKVSDGEVDIGVVGVKKDEFLDLLYEPVVRDRLVLIGKIGRNNIEMNELKFLKWVIREKGSGTRIFMESYFIDMGLDVENLNVVMEASGTEAVIRCVCEGMGVSVVSYLAVKNYIKAGLLDEIKVKGLNMQRNFYLVRHKQRYLFPASRCFIELLKNFSNITL